MTKSPKDILAEVFEGFDISTLETDEPEARRPLTLWIPIEKKQKYDAIQELTKQKFGKKLIELTVLAIDRIKIDEDEKEVG